MNSFAYRRLITLAGGGLLSLLLAACSYNFHLEDGDAARLAKLLSGEFSSAAQAAEDENFYPVHLSVVPIWTDRIDGHWLYVEQALESALDKPYRQRVYHVYRLLDEVFVSEVYTLADPEALIGADYQTWSALSLDDIELKPGCGVFLRIEGQGFTGGTQGQHCTSNLRGASYATSEVTVMPDGLTSWDRGFDAQGQQVWGATEGPYRFDRL